VKVGVVMVTHYGVGKEFLQAMRLIIPEAPEFPFVSLDPAEPVDQMRSRIQAAIREVDQGEGVLILTDMFGGTPSNVALSFLTEHRIEVVTGVNLPMLIKLGSLQDEKPLEELAGFIKEYGQRNISVASEVLPEGGG